MPNHIHGIVIIKKTIVASIATIVETQNIASLQRKNQPNPNKFGPQSQNLASIIRGYKIGVTKNAHQIHADFEWQPRFHDHIIRNDDEYQRINNYIETNPQHWENDKFLKPN